MLNLKSKVNEYYEGVKSTIKGLPESIKNKLNNNKIILVGNSNDSLLNKLLIELNDLNLGVSVEYSDNVLTVNDLTTLLNDNIPGRDNIVILPSILKNIEKDLHLYSVRLINKLINDRNNKDLLNISGEVLPGYISDNYFSISVINLLKYTYGEIDGKNIVFIYDHDDSINYFNNRSLIKDLLELNCSLTILTLDSKEALKRDVLKWADLVICNTGKKNIMHPSMACHADIVDVTGGEVEILINSELNRVITSEEFELLQVASTLNNICKSFYQ